MLSFKNRIFFSLFLGNNQYDFPKLHIFSRNLECTVNYSCEEFLHICSYYITLSFFIDALQLDERPSSALSAHERLFGSSREASSSPPESPSGKKGSSISSGDSSLSPIMSPIFKSDTARAIAKEVGLVDLKTKAKKRSLTITSSNPASVIEALNNHQAKVILKCAEKKVMY